MIGRIHLKRTMKRTAGCLSVAGSPFVRHSGLARVCILVYHRIAEIGFVDPNHDDWNVSPETFERQVKALAEFGQIIPLMDLPEKLRSDHAPSRPWICLTFDDGFANFYQQAVPILRQYQAPATLFVPTEAVGSPEPMPFDRWAIENHRRVSDDVWRAISWNELEQCTQTGLITIGSHSHHHFNGYHTDSGRFDEEASLSRDLLASRLGRQNARAYAYPYGSTRLGQVPDTYVDAVRSAGYELAVTTDLGLAAADADLFKLPRIEAHSLDGPAVIRAKASGSLKPYYLTDQLRNSHRK